MPLKKYLHLLFTSCILLLATAAHCQTKQTGVCTNGSNNTHKNFYFTKTESRKDSLYITHYILTDTLNVTIGDIQISYDRQKKIIAISFDHKSGSTSVKNNFTINYSDTLGIVFSNKQTFKKDPPAKSDLVVAFTTASKTFLKLSQIADATIPKSNFTLEKISAEDIAANIKLLTPPPPPVIIKTQSTVTDFWVDSVHVILKPADNDVISASVFFSGGSSNYPAAKEGIEMLAIDMAVNGGTKNMNATDINQMMESTGSTLSYNCLNDYSYVNLTTLSDFFNATWPVFCDMITKPLMNNDAFISSKQKLTDQLNDNLNNPDFKLNSSTMGTVFMTKNYDKYLGGSSYSIPKISIDDVKKFYSQLTSKQHCTVVVCGNISVADLTSKIKTNLKPLNSFPAAVITPVATDVSTSTINYYPSVDNENRLEGIGGAPAYGSADFVDYWLAIQLFNVYLNTELISNRNLCSSINISMNSTLQNYTKLTLTSNDPNKSVQLIIDKIKDLHKNGFSASDLSTAKDNLLSDVYLNLETNFSQTIFLGNGAMLGSWQKAESLNDDIQNCSLTEVNAAFKKYLKAFRFFYAGDKEAANEIIFTQKID